MNKALCPLCGAEPMKVIYFGLPGRLCPRCSCLSGAASCVPPVGNADGDMVFLQYEGSYFRALWQYLTSRVSE